MSFTRIGQILPQTVKRKGLVPSDFKVVRFSDGILTVACRNTSAIARLRENNDLRAAFPEAERIRFLLSPWR